MRNNEIVSLPSLTTYTVHMQLELFGMVSPERKEGKPEMSYKERGAGYCSTYDFIIVSVLTVALTFHTTLFCASLLLIPYYRG